MRYLKVMLQIVSTGGLLLLARISKTGRSNAADGPRRHRGAAGPGGSSNNRGLNEGGVGGGYLDMKQRKYYQLSSFMLG